MGKNMVVCSYLYTKEVGSRLNERWAQSILLQILIWFLLAIKHPPIKQFKNKLQTLYLCGLHYNGQRARFFRAKQSKQFPKSH